MIDQNWSRKDPTAKARDRNVKGMLEYLNNLQDASNDDLYALVWRLYHHIILSNNEDVEQLDTSIFSCGVYMHCTTKNM